MEKKDMGLVLIAITIILQLQIKECVGCLETERMGLLQLKSYLNSLLPSPQEGSVLQTWSDDTSNSDCCLWERVNCSDAIGGHIVHLSMNELLRMGPLGTLNLSLLHSFPQLQTLDFSGNGFGHLFDPIHGYKSFQSLEKLRILDLSSNYLNNSVLPFLSAAKSLRTLNLAENRMDGVFPPNELANMTELKVLILNQNKFSSFSVPGLINLRELLVLDLRYNIITDIKAGDGEKNKIKRKQIFILAK